MSAPKAPIPADARRIRTIIWSTPLLVVTTCESEALERFRSLLKLNAVAIDVLYNRLVLGQERRRVEVEAKKHPHTRLGDDAFMRAYPETPGSKSNPS